MLHDSYPSLCFIIETLNCLPAFFTPTQRYDNKCVTMDRYICEMSVQICYDMLHLHNALAFFFARMFQIGSSLNFDLVFDAIGVQNLPLLWLNGAISYADKYLHLEIFANYSGFPFGASKVFDYFVLHPTTCAGKHR